MKMTKMKSQLYRYYEYEAKRNADMRFTILGLEEIKDMDYRVSDVFYPVVDAIVAETMQKAWRNWSL